MSIRQGFFVRLFTQLLALLSAAGIAINPTTAIPQRNNIEAASLGPPGINVAAPVRQDPLVRILQTQLNGVAGIGLGLATTADAATNVILGNPDRRIPGVAQTLVNALDRNGLAGLPGGAADVAGSAVRFVEGGTNFWISTASAIVLSELDLLGGGLIAQPYLAAFDPGLDPRLEQAPFPDRFIRVQVEGVQGIGRALLGATNGVGEALLSAPDVISAALERGGAAALPAGLAAATARVVRAAQQGSAAVVTSLADLARGELSLVPGSQLDNPKFAVAAVQREPIPVRRIGPAEFVVRLPLAVAVAGSGLVMTGLDATAIVTGAFVTATSDIVRSVTNAPLPSGGGGAEATARAVEEPRLTLPQALAKAPVTIQRGFTDAGLRVRQGTQQAAEDFNNTLRGRSVEQQEFARVSQGTDNNAAKVEAVKPSKPRPVLGAIKAVTGTIKAVRNGIRTALGLPPRKPRPDPTQQKVDAGAPAS